MALTRRGFVQTGNRRGRRAHQLMDWRAWPGGRVWSLLEPTLQAVEPGSLSSPATRTRWDRAQRC